MKKKELQVKKSGRALVRLDKLAEDALAYASKAKSQNTVKAYQSDWNHFQQWCVSVSADSLPASPTTLALYLTAHAETLKTSTLQRRLIAIRQAHNLAKHEDPTKHPDVLLVWQGIRRERRTEQKGKAPAIVQNIRSMLDTLPNTLKGKRDRALLLVGFAGAFRRSELVRLDVEDLEFCEDGVVATIRRSKTDQEGQSRKVGIPFGSRPATCPVRCLKDWLESAGIGKGPVFRSVNRHGQVSSTRTSDKTVLPYKRKAGSE